MACLALAINLVLNALTIPIWGINGAAFSSSIGYAATTLLLLKVYCNKNKNNILNVLVLSRTDILGMVKALKKKLAI